MANYCLVACVCVCLAWGQYDPKSRPTTKANSRDLRREQEDSGGARSARPPSKGCGLRTYCRIALLHLHGFLVPCKCAVETRLFGEDLLYRFKRPDQFCQ